MKICADFFAQEKFLIISKFVIDMIISNWSLCGTIQISDFRE